MATRLATATQNAKVAAATARVDGHATLPGKIRIYSGTQPASANNTPGVSVLLAEFTCADPAYGAPSNGAAALDATPVLATTGLADGNAGWCRVLDGGDQTVFDGSVTGVGGGGDMELSNVNIAVDQDVELTGGTYAQPAS